MLLGGLGFINTSELPTGLFLIGIIVLTRNLTGIAGDAASPELNRRVREALQDTALFIGPLTLLAIVLYVPFYINLGHQAGGLDAVSNGAAFHLAIHPVLGADADDRPGPARRAGGRRPRIACAAAHFHRHDAARRAACALGRRACRQPRRVGAGRRCFWREVSTGS